MVNTTWENTEILEKLTTEEQVVALIKSSNSDKELWENTNRVKKDFEGYPSFWYNAIILSGVMNEVVGKWRPWTDATLIQVMFISNDEPLVELGKREDLPSLELEPLKSSYWRPNNMPSTISWNKVICWYDQWLWERMFICNTIEAMQKLYDNYAQGWALRINWYQWKDPREHQGKTWDIVNKILW